MRFRIRCKPETISARRIPVFVLGDIQRSWRKYLNSFVQSCGTVQLSEGAHPAISPAYRAAVVTIAVDNSNCN